MEYVFEMVDITKVFPGIKANDSVNFNLRKGEVHALLGENGAGKSTLMSVLFGLYQPDGGYIRIRGEETKITSPNVANELGIGMVHQHFKLVDNFTVTENIILGNETLKSFKRIDLKRAEEKVQQLSEKYGLKVDPRAKIEEISVGMQQRVEILKMLYRDANILIFDEPTAVLTPQEIEELMDIIKELISEGKSIVLITHKLKEIKLSADRCTVLRKGKYIGTVDVKDTNEEEMAEMMVGRPVNFEVEKGKLSLGEVVLSVENLTAKDNRNLPAVKNVSFEVKRGEILCIAGIEGNGQTELIESIYGLRHIVDGTIKLNGIDISKMKIRERVEQGIGLIPEDRHKHGLVLDFSLESNFVLLDYYKEPYQKNNFIQVEPIHEQSKRLIEEFDVRSGQGGITLAASMSGGNQQKAIVAREIDRSPDLLIAAQPTRGLDVGAIEYIHKRLVEQRDNGKAVLLISLELEEVLNVSDRIAVIYEGELVGVVDANKTNANELGLMMSGSKRGESDVN